MRISIDQSPEDDQWYIRYEGNNGEAFAMSEGFVSASNAQRSVLDFFESLGKQGTIQDGVVTWDVPVTITDRDNNKLDSTDGR